MRIVIVRHGISEFNLLERTNTPYFCGSYDTPLADEGRMLAKSIENNEIIKSIEKVYSSDLSRAYETATLAKPGYKIIKTKNLRERSLGVFENNPEMVIRKKYPEYFLDNKMVFRHDFKVKAPGGENYTDVCNRAIEFLNTLDLKSDETIGIFSHYHFIRCLIYTLTGITKEELMHLKIRNCDPIVLEGTEIGKFKLISHEIKNLMM